MPLCADAHGSGRRTNTVPFHRPCSAYYASTVNNIARPYKVAGWAVSDVFYALDDAAAAAADYPVRMRQRAVGDTHQRNVAEQQ